MRLVNWPYTIITLDVFTVSIAIVFVACNCSSRHTFCGIDCTSLREDADGANFVDEPVVEDKKVLTAKPEAYVDFGVKLASLVGAISEERVLKKWNLRASFRNFS